MAFSVVRNIQDNLSFKLINLCDGISLGFK